MHLIDFELLLLIIVANGTPLLGTALLGTLGDWPVDGGLILADGHRLLGRSKTWRGILLALSAAALMAWLLSIQAQLGVLIGCMAMLGDMLSSFIKRRLGMASSSMAFGLDQVPESLLPLLAVKPTFNLSWLGIVETVLGFIALELTLSQILYVLRIRKQPY